jgi:hypothetical protein
VKEKVEKEKAPRNRSKSPPSPSLQNLTPEERERLERRRLKFESTKVSKLSGRVVLKNSTGDGATAKSRDRDRDRDRHTEAAGEEKPKPKTKSRLGSRLGKVIRDDEEVPRPSVVVGSPETTQDKSRQSRQASPKRDRDRDRDESGSNKGQDPPPLIDKEDLRTKLQQKRAANVGRIFSVALQDTLVKESSSPSRDRDRDRDRYANRNKKSSGSSRNRK